MPNIVLALITHLVAERIAIERRQVVQFGNVNFHVITPGARVRAIGAKERALPGVFAVVSQEVSFANKILRTEETLERGTTVFARKLETGILLEGS